MIPAEQIRAIAQREFEKLHGNNRPDPTWRPEDESHTTFPAFEDGFITGFLAAINAKAEPVVDPNCSCDEHGACAYCWNGKKHDTHPAIEPKSQEDAVADKLYYLIEHDGCWWDGQLRKGVSIDCRFFTFDPNKAKRFDNKVEPQLLIERFGNSCQRVTEHLWVDALSAVGAAPLPDNCECLTLGPDYCLVHAA